MSEVGKSGDDGAAPSSDAEVTLGSDHALSLLRATLDATDDGILAVDLTGRVILQNQRCLEMWQLPVELADENRVLGFVIDQLKDAGPVMRKAQDLAIHPEAPSFDTLEFKDGRVFERYSRPQQLRGEIVGRVWSFRDATARRRVEAERDACLREERIARAAAELEYRRSAMLAEASRLLASLDFETALCSVARLAVPFLGDRCVIDLVDKNETVRRLVVAHADPAKAAAARALEQWAPTVGLPAGTPSVAELHQGLIQSAVDAELAGAPPVHAESRHPEYLRLLKELGMRSYISAPLLVPGRTIGVITLINADESRLYDANDLNLAQSLANRAALAVENARLHHQMREALRLRDEFLSVASHELNTPITALLLRLQAIRKYIVEADSADPAVFEHGRTLFERAERECKHLDVLINQLLDLSRIDSGQFALDLARVDLAEAVRCVVDRMTAVTVGSGCTISIRTENRVVGDWDRVRLEQLVTNLVSNALKFGAGRPIEIEIDSVSETSSSAAREMARLRVTDHGIGIPRHRQLEIFERYSRAVSSRNYGGLGLGLYIARRITDALDGSIRVLSSEGEGATFIVSLPLVASQ